MSNICEAAGADFTSAGGGTYSRTLVGLFTSKWSAFAMELLEAGPLRFGELRRRLGVSPKVLTQTLRKLEEYGLVKRVVYPGVPLRVEYSLTEVGCGAAGLLRELRNWVTENLDEILRAPLSEDTQEPDIDL
ncbi:DNA-binding transcriptional regulator, HxlR family [Amycolatopsis pretoriensis]|uniref:DNA-binding transcriptional regulator, HxlR family n=1 Tax=Amycolatopsis pretoriensis TaxID=218821 RepID=A0A1H5RJF0_9PSEU|nr:helix-turn-helix domain-containing protein [Amycolatopsis pretoriensis]SEF38485.1 DNA-binding transcriptional regulator, HxlR family [Amycolatopsis pretoriensis]